MKVAQNQVNKDSNHSATNARQRIWQNQLAQFGDNRNTAIAQRALIDGINESPRMLAQRKQIEGYIGSSQQLIPDLTHSTIQNNQMDVVQRSIKSYFKENKLLQGKFTLEDPAQQEQHTAPKPNNTGLSAKVFPTKLESPSHLATSIQAKLTIGQPGDKYEQEADHVATQVVEQINASSVTKSTPWTSVQSQEDPEGALEKKPKISTFQSLPLISPIQLAPMTALGKPQAKGMTVQGEASTDFDSAINSAKGSGFPLNVGLQQSMGQVLGADFSGVLIHTDARADQLNQSIQAKAFTTGQDVFFRQGGYEPESHGGQKLIAHELTHVLQQRGNMPQTPTIQRTLIPVAVKDDALRKLEGIDANALYMIGVIDNENWDVHTQEALLKEKDTDQLRKTSDLTTQLKALGVIRKFIVNRPNFLSLFNITIRNAIAAGKVGSALYNDIKSPFSNMIKKKIESITDAELKEKLTEDALSGYLLVSGKKSIEDNAKFLRQNLGNRGDFAENMENQLRKFNEADYLDLLKRRLREINEELNTLTKQESHRTLKFDERKARRELINEREKYEGRIDKKNKSRLDPNELPYTKIQINENRLKVLNDPRSIISKRVSDFIDKYSVGEIGTYSSEISLGAGKQEKPTSDFNQSPDQKNSVGYTVNIITGKGRTKPKKVAEQYYEEAFDANSFGGEQKKSEQVPYRMTMVIGINLFENLDTAADHKTEVKTFVETEGVNDKFPMVSFGFTWRPKWQYKGGGTVSFETVRADFNNMNPDEKAMIRSYERQNVTRIQENIPYGRLRDTVTASTDTQKQVAFLSKHNKTVYIYSGDDDAPSLKVPPEAAIKGAQGVFSRYDKVRLGSTQGNSFRLKP